MTSFPLILSLSAVLASLALPLQQRPSVEWHAVNQEMNEEGTALLLDDSEHHISLRGDWSCTVGETSKQLPLYEARVVSCRNEEHMLEFSVQCEPNRRKDHTQIRFRDADGRYVDFIDVGCEYTEAASW